MPQRQLLGRRRRQAFFGSLKKELIKKQIYKSRNLTTAAIADYIETFYNRSRRNSHLGGVSQESGTSLNQLSVAQWLEGFSQVGQRLIDDN